MGAISPNPSNLKQLFYLTLKEGDLAYHKIHGIVKFVLHKDYISYVLIYIPKYKKVNNEKITYWVWEQTIICTYKLKPYNKRKHGERPDFLK